MMVVRIRMFYVQDFRCIYNFVCRILRTWLRFSNPLSYEEVVDRD